MRSDDLSGIFVRSRQRGRDVAVDAAERARQRTRAVMIAGTGFNFAIPLVAMVATVMMVNLPDEPGAGVFYLVVGSIPFLTGALVAFMGITLTGSRGDVVEWGFSRPNRCFLYGLAPYIWVIVFPWGFPLLLPVTLAWVLTIAGGLLMAGILSRSTATKS